MSYNLDLLINVLRDTIKVDDQGSVSDVERDVKTLRSRFKHEGLSFLTTTLPKLGKAVLKGFEEGYFKCPPGFKKRRGQATPRLFRGLLKYLFEIDGRLRPDVDPAYVRHVQTVCFLFYKCELPYKAATEQAVIDDFVAVEQELADWVIPSDAESQKVLVHARMLIGKVLEGWNPKNISPKHGPGSVATGERLHEKYAFRRKYQRLHQEYPYYDYFAPSLGRTSFISGWYQRLEPSVLPFAKVVLVPKDSRGPRLISMEPLEIQWIQQGLARSLIDRIESSRLTSGFVNFEFQQINRDLAQSGSKSGLIATMDLKSASDRVPLSLVRRLFPSDVVRCLEACRSIATRLPNRRLVTLRKFAPMGSALCFPVMALTLWALVKSIQHLANGPTKKTAFKSGRLSGGVYVYGDDLIVPTDIAPLVFDRLPAFFLRINEEKSYFKGPFRESCGMDAYGGTEVTPVRCRVDLDRQHNRKSRENRYEQAHAFSHILSLSRSLYTKGYWHSSLLAWKVLRRQFWGLFPRLDDSEEFTLFLKSSGEVTYRNSPKISWDADLQLTVRFCHEPYSPIREEWMWYQGRLTKGLVTPTIIEDRRRDPTFVTSSKSSYLKLGKSPTVAYHGTFVPKVE